MGSGFLFERRHRSTNAIWRQLTGTRRISPHTVLHQPLMALSKIMGNVFEFQRNHRGGYRVVVMVTAQTEVCSRTLVTLGILATMVQCRPSIPLLYMQTHNNNNTVTVNICTRRRCQLLLSINILFLVREIGH